MLHPSPAGSSGDSVARERPSLQAPEGPGGGPADSERRGASDERDFGVSPLCCSRPIVCGGVEMRLTTITFVGSGHPEVRTDSIPSVASRGRLLEATGPPSFIC